MMNISKVFFCGALFLGTLSGYATDSKVQDQDSSASKLSVKKVYEYENVDAASNHPTLKWYGFVRNYFYYDSRENIQSNSGLFNQIPKDENLNSIGEDLNEDPSSSFLAITSRIGLNFSGLRMLHANASAKIEADFCGFSSSTTMLRIRQAYMKLKWEKQSVLAGQTWHPMFGDDMPDVLALSTGSPFQPFSRTPQVRYDFFASSFRFTVDALWQMQFKSTGPDGQDVKYQNNAIMPELYGEVSYQTEKFKLGAGVDILRLKPRTSIDVTIENETDTFTESRKVSETVISVSPMVYLKYKVNNFSLLAKALWAQNTTQLNMMSGYAVTAENEDGSRDYSPMRGLSTWADLSYCVPMKHNNKVKFNVFGGFYKNYGCKDQIVGDVYMKNSISNFDYFYRISPSVSYLFMSHFTIGLEYEMTNVCYGDDIDEYGKVDGDRNVANHRLCGMLKYTF